MEEKRTTGIDLSTCRNKYRLYTEVEVFMGFINRAT